jgi:glycerol-3-phosphate dehydrogenase subunit C
MLRAEQVLHRNRPRSVSARLTDQALGRTDLAGTVNTALAPVVNKVVETPGGTGRKLMAKVVGIASERVLPPYARQRFSTWCRKRRGAVPPGAAAPPVEGARGDAVLFPTCIVDYQTPQVGKDLVRVYERNDICCSLPDGQVCCGAPWLHAGDVENFRKQGRKNVAVLAGAIRSAQERGADPAVVVPQPTCGYVLKHDYKDYIGGPDAELVAEHTHDTSEYLMKIHKAEGGGLDTEFPGEVPESVTYHAPCHLRAQNIGLKSRDLVKLTGAKVNVVAECSGIDGTWGYREKNYDASRQIAAKMAKAIERAGGDVVVGDCHLANGGIVQETGRTPQHPMSTLARAYGIPED